MKQKEKSYKGNYDDSSDEEQTDLVTKASLKTTIENAKNQSSDSKLSLLLHDIGIRLIKSKEVHDEYYRLKYVKLENINISENTQIRVLIQKALTALFNQCGIRKNDTFIELQSNLEQYILNDKRQFIKLLNNHSETKQKFLSKIKETIQDSCEKFLSEISKNWKALDIHTTRTILDNSEPLLLDNICNPKGLAMNRLIYRSDMRQIRNLQDLQDKIHTQDTITRLFTLDQNSKKSHSSTFTLYISGKRNEKVIALGTYEKISQHIDKYTTKYKLDDSSIAMMIVNIINGKKLDLSENIGVAKEYVKDFITNLTYLLFVTEVGRNPASLLIHRMALDLVISEKCTLAEVFKLIPMSMVGAVSFSRWQHHNYKTVASYKYDQDNGNDDNDKGNQVSEFIKMETDILKKWLLNEEIEDNNLEFILAKLIKKCKEWFGIDLGVIKIVELLEELLVTEYDEQYSKDILSFYEDHYDNEESEIFAEIIKNHRDMSTECNNLSDIIWLYKNDERIYHLLRDKYEFEEILETEKVRDIVEYVNDKESQYNDIDNRYEADLYSIMYSLYIDTSEYTDTNEDSDYY
jgi:hypothetical protein